MADFKKENINGSSEGSNDVISDLEALSKKYGLSFDGKQYRTPPASSQYSPVTTSNTSKSYTPPKNNNPAGIPRIVYDLNSSSPAVRIVYGNEDNSAKGPEGRRVIYSEQETESIAEKRMRNRAVQKSEKGSAGFGSQPFVRHVASSPEAMIRDDGEKFSRTYEDKKLNNNIKQSATADTPVSVKTSARLVAANQETKKKHTAPAYQHYEPTAGEKINKFFKAFIPWKGDPAKEVVRKLVMNVSAILVLFCFGYFVDNYIQHQNKVDTNRALEEMQTYIETDDLAARWAAIKAKYPNINFPDGMNIRFAELYAQNQDLVGWLKIDNTNIDTSVLHHIADRDKDPDEDNFYLYRNFYKQNDKYGNPFLDPYNTGYELDQNNIIYGHNMTDGLSFAQLEKYYTIDGFKESPIIQYSTLFKDYYFKVYAVIITNGFHSGDNGYLFDYTVSRFNTEENFMSFINALDERKLYDTGVEINADDKLITLSTCSYEIKENQMGRLAVIGRLVRPGESTAVDTSKAVENTDIRYPQIWYDEHNMTNPYRDAFRWIPE